VQPQATYFKTILRNSSHHWAADCVLFAQSLKNCTLCGGCIVLP
jgi:hypothetical protein